MAIIPSHGRLRLKPKDQILFQMYRRVCDHTHTHAEEVKTYTTVYASIENTSDYHDWVQVAINNETLFNQTRSFPPPLNPLWTNIGQISLAGFNNTIYFYVEFEPKDLGNETISPTNDVWQPPIEHVTYHLLPTPETNYALLMLWGLVFGILFALIEFGTKSANQ